MNNHPDITIIVPCYNAAPYLAECIDSLKSQTIGMERLQFIFVDDASTDSTLDILKCLESALPEQVLLLALPENQGQGYARNLALSYAVGAYVLYVDADDTIADYAAELLFPQAQALQCDVLEFDFFRQQQPWLSTAAAFETAPSTYQVTDIVSRQVFCTSVPRYGTICNKLYRRQLLVEHGICNAEHLAHEDTLFSQLASLYVTNYAYLPVPLYFYRPNPHSTMLKARSNDLHQFDRLKVQLQFLEECERRGLLHDCYLAVETMFLRTYYMDTLLFICERFTEAPLTQLQEMQRTVQTCFPSWRRNPFLAHQQTDLEKLLLSTLDDSFSWENFQALKNKVGELCTSARLIFQQ